MNYLASIGMQTSNPKLGYSEKTCSRKEVITIYDKPPSNCALEEMSRKPMAEMQAGRQEIACMVPICKWNEKWYKVTAHEVAIMVKIKRSDMEKDGKYQCTNKVKEDMVGWVTIWKKLDPDALKN